MVNKHTPNLNPVKLISAIDIYPNHLEISEEKMTITK